MSLTVIVGLANLIVIAVGIAFAIVIHEGGTGFALGVIAASCVYNICHRVIYGHWL